MLSGKARPARGRGVTGFLSTAGTGRGLGAGLRTSLCLQESALSRQNSARVPGPGAPHTRSPQLVCLLQRPREIKSFALGFSAHEAYVHPTSPSVLAPLLPPCSPRCPCREVGSVPSAVGRLQVADGCPPQVVAEALGTARKGED